MLPFNWSAAERPQPLDFFTLVNSKTLAACFPLFQTSSTTRGAIAHEKKKNCTASDLFPTQSKELTAFLEARH